MRINKKYLFRACNRKGVSITCKWQRLKSKQENVRALWWKKGSPQIYHNCRSLAWQNWKWTNYK